MMLSGTQKDKRMKATRHKTNIFIQKMHSLLLATHFHKNWTKHIVNNANIYVKPKKKISEYWTKV